MTEYQPTPQTPEQVNEGLRNAMKQAKEDGLFDWGVKIHQPKVICRCDLFGQGQMVISFYDIESNILPIPNRWIRFWTRVFFNSKWEFENDT
jgi:hypothetical protein